MARSITSDKLRNRTGRLKWPKGKWLYVPIQQGLALGYRRAESTGAGSWQARAWNGQRYKYETIGLADDHVDADGVKVLNFLQAQDKARHFFSRPNRPRDRLTVREAASSYLEWFRVARKTTRETENVINAHILPTFGDTKIAELTPTAIRNWHHKLASKPARKRSKRGAKPAFRKAPQTEDAKLSRKATANRILTVLKAILNKAFEDDLVSSREAWSKVKPFSGADEPVVRFLTQEEATRLLQACAPDFCDLVRGALLTGARFNELATLKVQDVTLTTRRVYLAPSKTARGRHVPLNDEGVALFERRVQDKDVGMLVFTKNDGGAWGKNHYVRPLLTASKEACIEPAVTFHVLRHTYASLLAQAGVDLLTISKLLGHRDTRITSRHYAHLCDKTLANAVNALLPSFSPQATSAAT